MAALIHIPHSPYARTRLRVRAELRSIGGIRPASHGFLDTQDGLSLVVGSGITNASPVVTPEGQSLDFTSANTGLTKATSFTNHPFTLVFAGRIDTSSGNACLGSIATTADKTVRVFQNAGTFFAQHIGATSNASATSATVAQIGTYCVVVAVFASPTELHIYAKGNLGISHAVTTTNVGALGTLNKFCIGTYDGSVKTTPVDGQIRIAQWLNVALSPSAAMELLNFPELIYEQIQISLPFDAAVSGTTEVTSDCAAAYAVLSSVAVDRAASYAVRSEVLANLAGAYTLANPVAADLASSYSVRSEVLVDRACGYAVRSQVASDSAAAYAVIAPVAPASLDVSYSVLSVTQVSADYQSAYSVIGTISADQSASYGVSAQITSDRTASYSVLAEIIADRSADYGIFISVSETLTASFSVTSQAEQDLIGLFSVNSEVFADLIGSYITGLMLPLKMGRRGVHASNLSRQVSIDDLNRQVTMQDLNRQVTV